MDTREAAFNILFTKNVPHILERIFFSFDYDSFKTSFKTWLNVSIAWNKLLMSEPFQTRMKSVFKKELLWEEYKLLKATKMGEAEKVKRLLSSGMVDVTSMGGWKGNIPQFAELYEMNTKKWEVKLLVCKDPKPGSQEHGCTLLHVATWWGWRNVVQLLLEEGADCNKPAYNGWTPLHVAASRGHKDLFKFLLERGADSDKADLDGRTPGCLNQVFMDHELVVGSFPHGWDMAKTDKGFFFKNYITMTSTWKDPRNHAWSKNPFGSILGQFLGRFFKSIESDPWGLGVSAPRPPPQGWELEEKGESQVYFMNHKMNTRTRAVSFGFSNRDNLHLQEASWQEESWLWPLGKEYLGLWQFSELMLRHLGWERRVSTRVRPGRVYYVQHGTNATTWVDPTPDRKKTRHFIRERQLVQLQLLEQNSFIHSFTV